MHINTVKFAFLLLAQSIWTYSLFGLRAAHIASVVLILDTKINQKRLITYICLLIYFILYSYGRVNLTNNNAIQYSVEYWIFCIVVWLLFFEFLSQSWKKDAPKVNSALFFLAYLIAIIPIMASEPNKLFQAVDGNYGFFIEKGVFGQYLALVSCLLFSKNKSQLNFIIFISTVIYTLAVIQSNRSLLIYLSFFILNTFHSRNQVKFSFQKIVITLFALIITSVFFSNILFDTYKIFISKMVAIENSSVNIGRYAAIQLLLFLDTWDFLFGKGLGSYLNDRQQMFPLLMGQIYDYPGSLLIQSLYELGFFLTAIFSLFFTKAVFGNYKLIGFLCIIILGAVGGFQDAFSLFTYYSFSIISRNLSNAK